MAAVRQEVIAHFAVPRFLGRWVQDPKYVPLLLVFPAILLGLTLLARQPVEKALGFATSMNVRITFSYSSFLPHWLLNSFFIFFTVLAIIAAAVGIVRFWHEMKSAARTQGEFTLSGKSVFSSIMAALKKIMMHENFTLCTTSKSRFLPHFSVFFGFIALLVVTLWVTTSRYNPLIQGSFVYPFNFWNPLKILANLGGLAVLCGSLMMIYDRLTSEHAGHSTFSDWFLLGTLLAVVGTGFATELLHYARLTPHRHIAYFIHLISVFTLIVYLPYSKFAHLIYRTAALAFVEFTGRNAPRPAGASVKLEEKNKRELQAAKGVA